jgi:hypothetical protein
MKRQKSAYLPGLNRYTLDRLLLFPQSVFLTSVRSGSRLYLARNSRLKSATITNFGDFA